MPDPRNIDLAIMRLLYAGPTASIRSGKSRLYELQFLADFMGPAYGSRMIANKFRADRVVPLKV
jgi:hypothetical protein